MAWKFGKEDAPAAYTVGERSFTPQRGERSCSKTARTFPAGLSCSGSTSCWEIACGADGVPESLVYVGEVYTINIDEKAGRSSVRLFVQTCICLTISRWEAGDDALFKAAYVALGNAHHVRDLLLRVLGAADEAEAHEDDLLLPVRQHRDGRVEHFAVCVVLSGRTISCPSVPRMSESSSSLPSQSVLRGSSKLTSARCEPHLRRYMSISFSMQREA